MRAMHEDAGLLSFFYKYQMCKFMVLKLQTHVLPFFRYVTAWTDSSGLNDYLGILPGGRMKGRQSTKQYTCIMAQSRNHPVSWNIE